MHERPLIEVINYKKWYPVRSGLFNQTKKYLKAVDGVSFTIQKGETLGLVGESGSGKTTTGKGILRLFEPTDGQIIFNGIDVTKLNNDDLRILRRDMQIIYQDPYSSLNPRMKIGEIIGESLEIHKIAYGQEKHKKVSELLDVVGLNTRYAKRYPHEFSGGQRQRIGIARALSLNPKFIVCDEPVSALDVSIQSQILNLLDDIQEEFGITYLFIAHGLAVVKHISDRVGVMYLGKLVELSECDMLFTNPMHPYTRALLSAIPIPDPEVKKQRIILEGDIPNAIDPPSGCRFHTRCPVAEQICIEKEPEFRIVGKGHYCACHLV